MQKRNEICACRSGKKYKKCCYMAEWEKKKEKERKWREAMKNKERPRDKAQQMLTAMQIISQF